MGFCKMRTQGIRNGLPLQWASFDARKDRQRKTAPVEEKFKETKGNLTLASGAKLFE